MTIRKQLSLAFVAILTLFALNLAVYLWSTARRTEALEAVRHAAERQSLTLQLRQKLSDLRRMIDLTMQSADGAAPLPEGTRQSFEEGARATLDDSRALAERTEPERQTDVHAFALAVDELLASWRRLLRGFGEDPAVAITEQVRAESLTRTLVDERLPLLEREERDQARRALDRSRNVTRFTDAIAFGTFFASLLVATLMVIAVSRRIAHGFKLLTAGADKIGRGELGHRIALDTNDECGALARRFDDMAEKLAQARTALADSARELELFFRLIDQSDDALMIIEPADGRVVEANAAACASVGYSKEEIIGQDIRANASLFNDQQAWDRFMKLLHGKSSARFEWEVQRRHGGSFPAEISARLVQIGDRSYIVTVARDITHSKALQEQLRELSNTDGLTGVLNRRAFDQRLALEWRRAARGQRLLSLLLIDVDCFKDYNDSLGHPAGDECLRKLAQAMSSCVRDELDAFARYGGEEFAALLSETGGEAARAVAARLQQAIFDLAMPHPKSGAASEVTLVTVSIGVGTVQPQADQPPKTLIRLADEALYQAKKDGRNCIRSRDGSRDGSAQDAQDDVALT